MATEFTIKHVTYRAGTMSAIRQFHVLRRIGPCLGKLSAVANGGVKLKYDADGKVTDFDGDLDAVITPLTSAFASMPDEEVEYVFNACLEVTERKQAGGGWAALRVNGTTMYDDLSLPALMQIVYYVIKENLTDFFGELPSLSALEGFLKAKGLTG